MKKILLIIVAGIASFASAQQFQFQMQNAIAINNNPSLTGTAEGLRINYAGQFSNNAFTIGHNFNYLSADLPIKKLHGGIGIQFYNLSYNNNTVNESVFNLSYAFQQNLGEKWALSIGASTGVERERVNYEKFTFGDYPTSLGSNLEPVAIFVPLNAGVTVYSEHWMFSFNSIYNTDKVIYSSGNESRSTFRHQGQIGYKLTPFANKLINFTPLLSYNYENGHQQLKTQMTFNTKFFSLGTAIASRDNFSAHLGIYIKRFEIKYQYTHTLSVLTNYSNNRSNSLSLQYIFPEVKNRAAKTFNFQLF